MGKAKWMYGKGTQGRIGNNSYYLRKGMQMIRQAGSNYTGSTSTAALIQQLIFSVLSAWATTSFPGIKLGLLPHDVWDTARTRFMSLNSDIVTVTDLESKAVEVDFPSLVCAEGRLVPPDAEVTFDEEAQSLAFTLAAQDPGIDCNEDDTIHALILSAGKRNRCLLKTLGTRGDGGMTSVSVPKYLDGELHVYVFATTADGKMASDSIYLPLA